jgi:dihydrofolate reductase
MPIFQAIAALSENRVIGNQGKIPWRLPEDFRWFKHRTMGGTLIMGRKTFESIGKSLPGRETLVITRNRAPYDVPNCCDLDSLDEALPRLPQPYWVCGGTQIYAQLLSQCTHLYLTRVKMTVEGDAYFPPFEHAFALDQTIHENDKFRVERWANKSTPLTSATPEDGK